MTIDYTSSGTAASAPSSPTINDTLTLRQIFACVNDMVNDAEASGGNEAQMYQAIQQASDYLSKALGWFIPVLKTVKMRGNYSTLLFTPPILSVVGSITNDGEALTTADYKLLPDDRFWANGPYTQIEIDPDSALISEWSGDDVDSVQIPAQIGLYVMEVDTGTLLNGAINASVTSLAVDDGSKVSPGMVLLVDNEQMLITAWGTPTASVTLIAANMDSSQTTIAVDDGTKVNAGEIIRIGFEQMKVLEIQTNTISVLRGWNRTAMVSHLDNDAVAVYRTVTVERAINGTTAATHANDSAISRYVAPPDVVYLCKQIATLMISKAKSGYAGRSGNADLGTVFYHDAFPRFEIERIKRLYWIPKA